MKKIMQLAALAGALTLAGPALACSTDTPDEWECLTEDTSNPSAGTNLINQGVQGPYTFSGITKLTAGLTAECSLSLEGNVEMEDAATSGIPGGVVYITVTDGSISGTGNCSSLSLDGFPWEATVDGVPGIPGADGGDIYTKYVGSATADISGIEVYLTQFPLPTLKICDGTLPGVIFSNGSAAGNPSSFKFNGAMPGSPLPCTVEGTLLSVDGDVDAW